MSDMSVLSPVDGVVMPLEQVPDPAFAEHILGDGIAVDPFSKVVVAPFSAKVTSFHHSLHAITLQQGALEVLIHIGVESVSLKGKGFKALVKAGDDVKQGQPLVEFDPDFLAKNIPCSWVIMVVTSPDGVPLKKVPPSQVRGGQDEVFSIPAEIVGVNLNTTQTAQHEWVYSQPITVPNANGIHARPAAKLAEMAKQFPFAIELEYGSQQADAKSLVSVMGLGITRGAQIRLRADARAEQAQQAVKQLQELLESGLGETAEQAAAEQVVAAAQSTSSNSDKDIRGLTVCSGIAQGKTWQWQETEAAFPLTAANAAQELLVLQNALAAIKQDISDEMKSAHGSAKAILEAHSQLLQDPFLAEKSAQVIRQGASAPAAFNEAIRTSIDVLKKTQNQLLMERVADLKDLRRRVLRKLIGDITRKPDFPQGCIVLAEDLLPSDVAYLDQRVRGVVLAYGSPTAHVGILLRNMGIASIASAGTGILHIEDGTEVALNASEGYLLVQPSAEEKKQFTKWEQDAQQAKLQAQQNATQPACMSDGTQVLITGNASGAEEAKISFENGADGLGLVRTEFLFYKGDKAPSLQQQLDLYQKVADNLHGKPVTLRTLDVGGDKPVSYIPLPQEDNPIVGLRGIRNYSQYRELFLTQIRAMLSVKPASSVHIMLPMVTFLDELISYRKLIEEEKQKLGVSTPVQIGIMIEVPSAALMAEQFAKYADFFSIGTNDLTQYTLAIDRGHKTLCAQSDPLDPAVLRLIRLTCQGAEKYKRNVAVCGAIAGDLVAAPVLIGLGVRELAVSANLIAPIKALVRKLDAQKTAALAQQALTLSSANEVRAFVKKELGI